jgi:FHS family L-fucose permease-like MFS transporter
VACAGAAVGVLFFFARLPEVQEATARSASIAAADSEALGVAGQYGHVGHDKPLYKEYNMIAGFVAQFCYVGAQVTIATFFINYATEASSFTSEEGARLLSYGLLVFTLGRFVAAGIAMLLESNFVLMVYSSICIALTAYVSNGHGTSGVACIIVIFFFMAPMYPSIFTLGTANLGRNTRRGAGILVMGVSGGAVFPPIQGAIADAASTRISYLVPMVGFIVVLVYVTTHWIRHGFHILRVKGEDVVATALEGGVLGGAVQTVHYDQKRLSIAEHEEVRRSSLAGATVNPMTGGYRMEAGSQRA